MIEKEPFTEQAILLSPALRRIATSILSSDADAQDAVQQALLNAWRRHDTIDEKRFKPYLTRIVVNECRNILRRRMRVSPQETLPEQTAPQKDKALLDTLNTLDESLRTPLLLHYMEGYTPAEIAQSLQLSLVQVKGHMFRARKKLRSIMEEDV